MNTLLTNEQLYVIVASPGQNASIRQSAGEELNKRQLSPGQLKLLVAGYPLHWQYKLLLLVFPFFILIHVVITSKYLARNQEKKWKSYWFYVTPGYLLWTIAAIVTGRFYLGT